MVPRPRAIPAVTDCSDYARGIVVVESGGPLEPRLTVGRALTNRPTNPRYAAFRFEPRSAGSHPSAGVSCAPDFPMRAAAITAKPAARSRRRATAELLLVIVGELICLTSW